MKKIIRYFDTTEWIIWLSSLTLITAFFLIFDGNSYISFIASLIGATALIFCAKGNPLGQFLIIIFGLIYGYISFTYAYWGEMITYIGMSVPMAIYALITWLKNPYEGRHSEVRIYRITKRDIVILIPLTLAVTVAFYFILKYLGTSNLLFSTISISTSFAAVYLTARRSPYYALAYALNDVVLIILWVLASIDSPTYVSVVACFIVFLINDLYGYFNWIKMQKAQV